MTFNQLRYFCTVCQENSISRAAKALFVAAPSVSLAIKELEQEYGVSLFIRNNNKLTLTREGIVFREHAAKILNEVALLETHLRTDEKRKEHLKIGVSPYLAVWFIRYFDKVNICMKNRFSGLEITLMEIEPEKIEEEVMSGEIDLGICGNMQGSFRTGTKCIFESELKACMSVKNPLAKRRVIGMKDLEGQAVVRNFQTGSPMDLYIRKQCEQENAKLSFPFSFSNLYTIRNLLKRNMAICLTRPDINEILSEDVVSVRFHNPMISQIYVLYRDKPPIEREIVEYLEFLDRVVESCTLEI